MLHAAPRRGSANDKDGKERDKEKEKDREAAVEVEGDAEGEGADDGVEVFVADEAVDFGGLKQVCACVYFCVLVRICFAVSVPSPSTSTSLTILCSFYYSLYSL
jgi:hypothetical protein